MKYKHKCRDNDNRLKFIESDGLIEEVWVSDTDGGWIVIGFKDLREGLELAAEKFKTKSSSRGTRTSSPSKINSLRLRGETENKLSGKFF